jgi:hypothetical protein
MVFPDNLESTTISIIIINVAWARGGNKVIVAPLFFLCSILTSKAEPYCNRRHQIVDRPAIQSSTLFCSIKFIAQTYWLPLSSAIFVALNASSIPLQYYGEDRRASLKSCSDFGLEPDHKKFCLFV